jgi:hypothetical protein
VTARREPGVSGDGNGAAPPVGRPKRDTAPSGRPRHHTAPVGHARRDGDKTLSAETMAVWMGDDLVVRNPDAAAALNVSPSTLEGWHAQGEGPPPVIIHGRRIGYRLAALKRWVREHEQGGGGI